MKFLLTALLLCICSVAAQEEYYGYYGGEPAAPVAPEAEDVYDEPYPYEGEDAAEGGYYTERRRNRPTTEPRPVRQIFGVERWNINDVVESEVHEEGVKYRFDDSVIERVREDVIPELCYLTSDNITIYNSFLLDRNCLEEFESVSPQCVGFKCDLAHYFLEHGAQIYTDFFNATDYKEGMEIIHREFSTAFEKLDMCTCGREFFKALFKCAPFYNANALFAATDNYEDDIVAFGKIARNVDLKSAGRFFDRLLAGVCEETSSGICLNSIFNVLEEIVEMGVNTVEDFDDYDSGDRKYQKNQEKRCDAMFSSYRAWEKDGRDPSDFDGLSEEFWQVALNMTAKTTNAFYCEKKCKKDRGALYPCCLRRMLEDEKMFDNVQRVIESVYKIIPAMDSDFEWDGFYDLDYDFEREWSAQELEERASWTVPANLRDAFMRTLHAAKYCEGKIIRCSK